jgi:hypothetical protein
MLMLTGVNFNGFIQVFQNGIKPLHLPRRIGKDIVLYLLGLVVLKVMDQQAKIFIERWLRAHIKIDGAIGIKELLAKFNQGKIMQLVGNQFFVGKAKFGVYPIRVLVFSSADRAFQRLLAFLCRFG